MNTQELIDTARTLVVVDKGLQAMGENNPTCISILGFNPHHPEVTVIALWNVVSPERFEAEL